MKTKTIIAIIFIVSQSVIYGRARETLSLRGSVNTDLKYNSTVLGYDVRYSVYLPPDYETSGKRYPVLYLLHGFTGNNTSWIRQGDINEIMDKGINSGVIEPMIIIIPDGKYYWYINDYQSKARYEDFVFEELLPYIDKTYRSVPDREHRAVAGLSMGGYGALVWAMHHPDKFSYSVALSASMFNREGFAGIPDQLYKYMSLLYGAPGAKGNDRITSHFLDNNPLELAAGNNVESLRSVRWFIDCGNQDNLSAVNKELNDLLTKRNIEHVYHARDGKHDWLFWRQGIYQGLKFVSMGMRK